MAERLSRIKLPEGITVTDMATRPVVAVGYSPGELLPPYENLEHKRRAQEILLYLKTIPDTLTLAPYSGSWSLDAQGSFPDRRVIEVVGGFAEACVPHAIGSIINQGLYAYINGRRLFATDTDSPVVLSARARNEAIEFHDAQYYEIHWSARFYFPNNK